jgi:predicted secreted acid phosphatase
MAKKAVMILLITLCTGPFINFSVEACTDGACALKALKDYYEFAYETCVSQVMQLARSCLDEAIKRGDGEKLAIVLDVDDTSLSSRENLEAHNFCGSFEMSHTYNIKGENKAIRPTLEFYQYARANNVEVFFVTGRPERIREVTVKNLKAVGYTDFAGIYLKPDDFSGSRQPYKTGVRKKITESGYQIVINLGDQPDDIKGGFADHALLVPNPFYTIK